MEYIKSDFEGLYLNVFSLPEDTDLFKEFPILDKYSEFKYNPPGIGNNKILRYVIYAFDFNSPLRTITDVIERRIESLDLSGIKPGKKGYSETVNRIVHGLDHRVNNMIIRYCLLTRDADYTVMVTFEDALQKELQRLANFDEEDVDDKKSNIITNIKNLRKEVNELSEGILTNNVDYFLKRSLMDFVQAERLDLSPEYYAEKLRNWDNISKYYGRS